MTEKNDGWEPVSAPERPLPAGQALVVLAQSDNVAVAARYVRKGELVGENSAQVVAARNIPRGHKVALREIEKDGVVRKYAQAIGYAATRISPGELVHEHNLYYRTSELDYRFCEDAKPTKMVEPDKRSAFQGYRRAGGQVGTRNYVAVISSVNCSATAVRRIADHFSPEVMAAYPNVDGVAAFIHGIGCGMDAAGEGIGNLRHVIRGFATHPNVAGALLVGLGCEDNQLGDLIKGHGLEIGAKVKSFNLQSVGGTAKAIERGIAQVFQMLDAANECQREQCSASDLVVALQCGGSDGWSGITANPALGHAADLLVAQGGVAVLGETPEVYGAEHLLTARSAGRKVAARLLARIRWWEDYVARNKGSMDNNPSPGNKLGGLTTILEKSLGAVAKGGTTSMTDVLRYARPVVRRGFMLMDSPGYDPASVTGQIASGCNLVAFTTGRGSAFGSKPAPTVKICTNSATYNRMTSDMDINAGVIISEGARLEAVGEQIFARLLAVASGEKSKSEAQGLGDYEFVPWNIGATM